MKSRLTFSFSARRCATAYSSVVHGAIVTFAKNVERSFATGVTLVHAGGRGSPPPVLTGPGDYAGQNRVVTRLSSPPVRGTTAAWRLEELMTQVSNYLIHRNISKRTELGKTG